MRSFPGATRQRVAATVVGIVSLATLAVPLAHADDDDLKQRQREVEGQIDQAHDELDEASRTAARADRALEDAVGRLAAARTELRDVRARLQAARERDVQLKAELEQAEADLEQANADLAAGRQAVEDQRAQVKSTMIAMIVQGDPNLRAVGSFFQQGSIEDITRQRIADQVIVGKETGAFDVLSDIEDDLADEQAEVERTAQVVEDKRAEAADHLADVRSLYAEASAAADAVEGLVAGARTARQRAVAAKERDRRTLAALEDREARIKQQLIELARQSENQRGFNGASDGYLDYPTDAPVTSPYGMRVHPIYGYYSLHGGTDFGVPCGQQVYAAAAGTVIDTFYDSVFGNRLFLSIGNVNGKNLVLVYNHLSGYVASEGDRVARGDAVAYGGTTGWSTGCHLHFTVMADGVTVDPMTYL